MTQARRQHTDRLQQMDFVSKYNVSIGPFVFNDTDGVKMTIRLVSERYFVWFTEQGNCKGVSTQLSMDRVILRH
jgi:hypothetical protein